MTPPPPRRRLLSSPGRPAADPTTPIYNALATEWAAVGRSVPGTGPPPDLFITNGTTPTPNMPITHR